MWVTTCWCHLLKKLKRYGRHSTLSWTYLCRTEFWHERSDMKSLEAPASGRNARCHWHCLRWHCITPRVWGPQHPEWLLVWPRSFGTGDRPRFGLSHGAENTRGPWGVSLSLSLSHVECACSCQALEACKDGFSRTRGRVGREAGDRTIADET